MRIKSLFGYFLFYPRRKSIIVCLLTLTFLFASKESSLSAENNNSQNFKISLNKENAKIENVLDDIESQTDVLFVYNNDVNVNKRVSIYAKNKSLFDILDELFGKSVKYSVENSYIMLSTVSVTDKSIDISAIKNQDKRIKGVVLDSYNEPVIGANIVEKGTTNGTITDLDGLFSLSLQTNNPTLVISYIGFKTQEIFVGSESDFNIKLAEDTEALDEVVVVGYGVQKRASVTGSVASLQSKDIATVKTPNVTNTLAGKLPGLRAVQRSGAPGDDAASIDIRGFGNALVIVDGVERDFTLVDANDIESISVLKDASASVYGFKGANGVILVTTKKGEIGKPKINYSGYYGLQSITRYPKLLNGYEYATLYNEAQQNVGVTAPYSDEQLEQYKQGIGTTNWYDEVIRGTIPQMYHNLNVSGGSEKVKYYFSLGYTNQEGMYKSKDYNYSKYNVRSNISAEIVRGFSIDLQLGGWFDSRNKPYEAEPLTRSIQMAKPVFSIYANDNENYWSNPGDKGNPVHLSQIDNVGYDRRDRREFNGSIALNWQVPWIEGLSAKALLAYDYNNNYLKKWYKEYYEYVYNESADEYRVQGSHTLSELTVESKNYFKPNIQTSINYNRMFNNKHNINVLALFEAYNDRMDSMMAYRQFAIGAIDQIEAGDKLNMNNNGTAKVSAHAGLVGRLNYAYDNKYMAEVSFRYDGSYKFSPEKRWGFFPALSLGWRASEEQFFKDALPMVENFKLRGSVGKIGDEGDFAAYQYLTGYTYPNNSYVLGSSGLTNGAADRGMPNLNLTWYKSTTYNIGFEASALQGKLNAEFDYFVRKRDGLLATRILTLPTTFGQALPQENLNSDKTKGFEIVLGHRNQINGFVYDIKANFSSTRQYNDYIERAESSNMYDNWRNNSNDRYKDIKWGKKYTGQFQSFEEILNAPIQDGNGNKSLLPGDLRFEDVNKDGIIDDKDNLPIGYSNSPRLYYGLNLYGAYKGFDLTIFLQGAAGHSVFMGGDLMDPFIQQGLGNGLAMWMDRWHREDPTDLNSKWIPGYMPALRPTGYQNNTQNSTWTLQKADYLRVKTLEVGYTIPRSVLSKLSIEGLRVYVNSFNPFTFTNRTGIMKYMDPENDNAALRYYPQMKSFNFGVNLTF